jgi:N-acyl-phosphatidylethanolamine-hydrolysing phospholipase D
MKRDRFFNPHIKDAKRSLWDVVLWKMGYYDDAAHKLAPPADFNYPATAKTFMRNDPSAVWIGHSTYLLEVDGVVFLTDPVWDSHCSPIRLEMFRRRKNPPFLLGELPSIDFVLISHNHYDHLDAKTVAALQKTQPQIQWIVPLALSPWFRKRGIQNVTEIGWWDSFRMKNAEITAVPAQHFSNRGLWDRNKTHWNGYVVQTPKKRLYFTGDTGYNAKDFKQIGEKFPYMDLSLIPIGTYSPQAFMQPVHINPYEAVQIHADVRSRFSLGMHWNTFRLSEEPMNRPPYDLYLAMKEKKMPFETFLPIDIGVYVNF